MSCFCIHYVNTRMASYHVSCPFLSLDQHLFARAPSLLSLCAYKFTYEETISALTYFISMSHGRQSMQQIWLQYCRNPLQSPHGRHNDIQMSFGRKISTATFTHNLCICKDLTMKRQNTDATVNLDMTGLASAQTY